MRYLRAFMVSMTGQLFLLLVGGMTAAALIAGAASAFSKSRDSQRLAVERSADRLQAFIALLDSSPPEWRSRLLYRNESGVLNLPPGTPGTGHDDSFTRVLSMREGVLGAASADQAAPELCFHREGPNGFQPYRRRGPGRPDRDPDWPGGRPDLPETFEPPVPPDCRLVSVTLSDGTQLRLSVEVPQARTTSKGLLDPAFIILLGCGIVLLAYLAAHRASAPLRQLAQASTQLGQDLHRQPLATTGPIEVRQAVVAFNSMQARLQGLFAERTQMLAAITHDLQTPLTRLRLRLERVEDPELRERLIADLRAMRALIDEGLELARTAETPETPVMLDLDSVLESLVEDAAEAGYDATFDGGCGAVLSLRPLATRRIFANLIDNALVHGGSVTVRAMQDEQAIRVIVRDRGPGIPAELLDRAFEPFYRTEGSRSRETGGTGLGLTIARMLAEKIGATLVLRNHPEGGLEAQVRWPR